MKFYVCIKQVPDVNAPIQIRDGRLIQDSSRMVLNAYDASAVEEALVLTGERQGEVEVVLAGPENAAETIRKALAMGADRATHIKIEGDESHESAIYARVLAAFFKDVTYDVILCGKQSQDTDAGLTGGMLAEHLNIPYATNAVGLEVDEGKIIVRRQGDAGQELIELPPPCLVTCSNDMNEPRIPSLKGIMQSKRKPVETVELSKLDIDPESLQSRTRVTGYMDKPARAPGRKFEGDPEEIAREVAQLLDTEAGVI